MLGGLGGHGGACHQRNHPLAEVQISANRKMVLLKLARIESAGRTLEPGLQPEGHVDQRYQDRHFYQGANHAG